MYRGWETVDRDGEVQAGPCRTERLHLQQRHQLLGLQSAEVGQVLQSAEVGQVLQPAEVAIFTKTTTMTITTLITKTNFFDYAHLMGPLTNSCSGLFSSST